MDLGAFSVMLWAFEKRELIYDIFEAVCGARLTTSWTRVGGLMRDVPDFFQRLCYNFLDEFEPLMGEFNTMLTGNRISATEAERYGLVNAVVPTTALDETVDVWAEQIVECAPLSIKAIKECVKETSDLPISVAQSRISPALVAALESEDSEEGPRAFREKRKPEWKGR